MKESGYCFVASGQHQVFVYYWVSYKHFYTQILGMLHLCIRRRVYDNLKSTNTHSFCAAGIPSKQHELIINGVSSIDSVN